MPALTAVDWWRVLSDTGGARTSYGYDRADRLTSVNAPSGRVIALAYDDARRRISVAYPNGLTTSAAFETPLAANGNAGRLKSIAHGLNAAGQGGSALNLKLGAFAYSYDVKGNIIAANETAAAPRARSYTLDAIERLTSVKDGGGASLESYTLDQEGNRIVSHKSSFHVTDAANRLQEDANSQFEYDVNGNMVRKTNKLTGITWRYAYTVYDELASASRHSSADAASPALEKVTYVFDALGRRVAERRFDAANAPAGGMNFHYDGEEVAHEADVNTSGAVTNQRWTTHSDGTDDLLAVTLPAGTGAVSPTAAISGPAAPSNASFYYHTDHQGSVRAVTDQNGAVTNTYAYDSYGTAQESVESLAQRFRYTGREFDALTGLHHYRARAYDPETARFLQEDPLWFGAGDLNVYRYVHNNPHNWTDPSGMAEGVQEATLGQMAVRTAYGIAAVGNAASCGFNVLAGIIDVINTAQNEGFSIKNIATYTVRGAGIALECGAGTKAVKKLYDSCGGSILIETAFFGAGLAAANIDFLLSYGKSFDGDTKIMTRTGYVAIKDIAVGDEVASIDEKTGKKVWRKVTELFSRQAPNTLNVELEDEHGKRIRIKTTLEHPFHVEEWDGKVETMIADLNGSASVDPSRLFPSDGKTPFGDWVNAGALKAGDKVSTRDSIGQSGPRIETAANDNDPLTVTEIIRDSRAARVYNFEVESREGEITHNYFVGDEAAWVHNRISSKTLR
jgi:RHS repeat-associated protein